MRAAQVNAKVWNRKMKANVTKTEDIQNLQAYN